MPNALEQHEDRAGPPPGLDFTGSMLSDAQARLLSELIDDRQTNCWGRMLDAGIPTAVALVINEQMERARVLGFSGVLGAMPAFLGAGIPADLAERVAAAIDSRKASDG